MAKYIVREKKLEAVEIAVSYLSHQNIEPLNH